MILVGELEAGIAEPEQDRLSTTVVLNGGRLDSRAFTIELYEPLIIFGCNGDAQLGDRLTRCGHFPNIPFLFALPIIRR